MGNLVVQTADGSGSVMIAEDNLLYITTDTLGSLVTYVKESNGLRHQVVSSQSPATLAGGCTDMISCVVNGATVYVNANRVDINQVQSNGTNLFFTYDDNGQANKKIVTTTAIATFLTSLLQAKGYTVYNFDDVNKTNGTISLTAATGDVSSSFGAGVYFTVGASTTSDMNKVFRVSSSTFSGGKTVITINTSVSTLPTGASETGILYLS